MITNRKINPGRNTAGFTLIELLVVLMILGLLAGLVGPRVLKQLGGAKSDTAQLQPDNGGRPYCTGERTCRCLKLERAVPQEERHSE